MSSTLLSIRTDDKTKKEITEFANSVGLSVSAFVTVVLKQTMHEGKVVLSPPLEPTPYLKKLIQQAEEDHKAGRATPSLNREEAQKHLRALMK
jgi:antitoxin component of RelBE/YafQ-DinJ toxin-antitoxin module